MLSIIMKQKKHSGSSGGSPQPDGIGFESLGAVVDCLGEATAICDYKGRVLHVNQPLLHMFCPGQAETDSFLQKKNLGSLLCTQDVSVNLEGRWNELLKNGSNEFECDVSTVSEVEKMRVVVSLRLLDLKDNHFVLVSIRDITRMKRLELELATAKKSIEELATEVQSEFLANMSHELRTPMHSILSCARLGLRKVECAPRERLKSYLKMIVTSGDQLLILLNDLLALTTPESHRAAYTLTERNLVEDISKVVLEFQGLMEESKISLDYEPPHFMAMARYDVTKVYQVMRNLLSNAVKFTAPDKMIRVTLQKGAMPSGELPGAAYKVSVIDQGMGLDKEELLTIFNKFTQGRKVMTGTGGVGLGLSICKRIIDDHEGIIWAEQNEDNGTTFSFLLPALE